MGVTYDGFGSPLVESSEHAIWRSGERCPDVIISSKSASEPTRLYSEVSYGKFVVLSIGKSLDLSSTYGPGVTSYSILPSTSIATEQNGAAAVNGHASVTKREFQADWVSPEDAFVVIVRPDMYIGFVGSDQNNWEAYLDSVFTRSS